MKVCCLGMYCMARNELSYEARVVHYMAEQGVEVDYYTGTKLDYSREVYEKPKTLRNFVFAKGEKALLRTPRTLAGKDVKTILKNGPYDVIFGTATTAIDMGTWLKELLDIPLVIQWLDVPTWRITRFGASEIYRESIMPLPLLPQQMFDAYRAEWSWWFSKIPEIDAITTLHQVTKKHIMEFYGKELDNIHVIYHGSVDRALFDKLMQPNVERKNQVLSCSRLVFHKGIDKFLHVSHLVQQMMKDNPPHIVIASTGYDWYEELLKDYAKRLGLKNYVFTGWVSNAEKVRLLQESKVSVVCCWDSDTTPGCVAGESFYCETPLVCWDLPQARDVYREHAFYIEKNDYEGMANIIAGILRGEVEWDSRAAKNFVAKYRSIESHAKGIIRILEKFA